MEPPRFPSRRTRRLFAFKGRGSRLCLSFEINLTRHPPGVAGFS
jgi:hypothetical protein